MIKTKTLNNLSYNYLLVMNCDEQGIIEANKIKKEKLKNKKRRRKSKRKKQTKNRI